MNRVGSAILFQNQQWPNVSSTFNFQVWSHFADINTGTLTGDYFDSWHHFCYVYTGQVSSSQLFIDGAIVASIPSSLVHETINTADAPVTLGKFRNDGGVYSSLPNSSIDNVGIWNRALTADEVLALYNSQRPVYEVTLTTRSSTNLSSWPSILTNKIETYNPSEFYKNEISVTIKPPAQ